MKREIKFRVWDKYYNFMISSDEIYPYNYEIITGDGKVMEFKEWHTFTGTTTEWEDISDKRILMQYTGLKDKNGVEIYEGDIVRADGEYGDGLVGEIYYKNGCFMLQEHALYQIYNVEVIGNIYENPELIKEAAE